MKLGQQCTVERIPIKHKPSKSERSAGPPENKWMYIAFGSSMVISRSAVQRVFSGRTKQGLVPEAVRATSVKRKLRDSANCVRWQGPMHMLIRQSVDEACFCRPSAGRVSLAQLS